MHTKESLVRESGVKLIAVIVIASFILGCAGTAGKCEKAALCPRCRRKVVRHRFARRGSRGHRHVRYICPSCKKEWSGPPGKGLEKLTVCPHCGCTIKECAACRRNRGKRRPE